MHTSVLVGVLAMQVHAVSRYQAANALYSAKRVVRSSVLDGTGHEIILLALVLVALAFADLVLYHVLGTGTMQLVVTLVRRSLLVRFKGGLCPTMRTGKIRRTPASKRAVHSTAPFKDLETFRRSQDSVSRVSHFCLGAEMMLGPE